MGQIVGRRYLAWGLFIISCLGLFDAAYLTVEHFMGGTPVCSFFDGCDLVLTSSYATFYGVPVALVGVVYYLTLLTLAAFYLERGEVKNLKRLATLATLGFIASLYFIYLQLYVIKALCFYCLLSAGVTMLVMLLGWIGVRSQNHEQTV